MTADHHSEKSLEKLLDGVRRFHRDIYSYRRDTYEQAVSKAQEPHTLVITCADSRIDPELLTQSGPGDIFVTRNIGNLVPAHGLAVGAVSAVIEYAVSALGVDQIVICGHTDCGAMKGLLHPEKLGAMPAVGAWLKHAEAAVSVVQASHDMKDEASALHQLTRQNVLLQLNHLRTHPSVAGRIAQGKLAVYGWVYDIGAGNIHIYDPASNAFVPLMK